MKKFLLILCSLIICVPIVSAEEKIDASLSKCVDGDTAYFYIQNTEKKFRFLAIDTPETVHPTKGEESGGKLASEYTCELLTNAKNIQVLYDEKGGHTDKYGRELAWIYIDDVLLQEKLISEGIAEVAYIYYKYDFVENLCNVQKVAIENNYGIWNDGTRKEGYCKTKSNSTTATTKKVAEKSTTIKASNNTDKIIDYLIDEKYEQALELMIEDTKSIYILIILLALLVIVKLVKKRKK